jgi:hypothetical protein
MVTGGHEVTSAAADSAFGLPGHEDNAGDSVIIAAPESVVHPMEHASLWIYIR